MTGVAGPDAVGVSWPGRRVTSGPVGESLVDGFGRYIDCWLDAVPVSSSPSRPSIELAARAPPLISRPTTIPTPASAAMPEMTGWPSLSLIARPSVAGVPGSDVPILGQDPRAIQTPCSAGVV